MKKIHIDTYNTLYVTKAIAFLGVLLSLLSLGLAIASIIPQEVPTDIDDDVSQSFAFWVYSYMAAFPGIFSI